MVDGGGGNHLNSQVLFITAHLLSSILTMPPSIQKGKRKRLSLKQKVEIINLLNDGDDASKIVRSYGISRRLVSTIKATRGAILHQVHQDPQSLQSKAVRKGLLSDIETFLYSFVTIARSIKMPISIAVLRAKALMIRDKVIAAETTKGERTSSDVQIATFQPLPPRSLIFGHLDELENSIVNCNAREMIWLLRRLRKLYGDARKQEERGASRQLLITEMIPSTIKCKT